MTMYLVLSTFSFRTISLLATMRASVFFFTVYINIISRSEKLMCAV